jgi:PGAP1-like protein
MAPYLTSTLGFFSLVAILLFYCANSDIAQTLSPQGCRMSWMSPSYILQNGFDSSWSPLARRYSLWLYREVGWDSNQVRHTLQTSSHPPYLKYGKIQGIPVLFIPGNAGSSRQVRSIASSATRQFYSSPQVVASEFSSDKVKPLDFFAGMKCFRYARGDGMYVGGGVVMQWYSYERKRLVSMYTAPSLVHNTAVFNHEIISLSHPSSLCQHTAVF